MGKDGTRANYYRNKEKRVGMDWPYSSTNIMSRHLTGTLKERGKWEGQGKRGEGVWRKS